MSEPSLRTTDPVPDPDANGDPSGTMDPLATTPPASDAAWADLPEVPGYRVLREIARGGMGRVLAAHDLALDREVALKVLLSGSPADRFLRESLLTARLPHPGIPPVHALGTLADGSPFLAMKLVAGRTLAQELMAPERTDLLGVFAQVCQAVGFAHSRGIVHRDLKPANVMVGAFGEVQVMDWGLAKEIGAADATDPDAPRGVGALPGQTQVGVVLGTPAFMAPEQARGEAADARADVFALGGILCVILTGQPPFGRGSAAEIVRRAAAADLAEAYARLDGCGADAELVDLCRRCLSADAVDRPADGRTVAEAVAAYRAGVEERLRQAERERAAAAARQAELRKRRRVQLALGLALALLLVGGSGFAWWQSQRLGRNAEAVAGLLDQCQEALKAGDAAKAAVTLEAAQNRAAEGGASRLAGWLQQAQEDLAVLRDLDAIDQFRWAPVESKWPNAAVVAARYREALARFGADPDAVPPAKAAARVSASAVRERLMAALDRLLRQEKTAGVREALQVLDPDLYRDAVRDAVQAGATARVAELVGRPAALEQPGWFVAVLGEDKAVGLERRRELLVAAIRRRPNDLTLVMTQGETYPLNQRDGADERAQWYQAAVAVAPGNAASHNNLGLALQDKGDLDGALAECREAIRLNPKESISHNNLGVALGSKGDVEGAIAEYREAIRLDPKQSFSHSNLGLALGS
jgi:tetratricopeptide (TPR) repeat protein